MANITPKKRYWVCPSCGREFPRIEGRESERCICGAFMEATVEKNEGSSVKLERLED